MNESERIKISSFLKDASGKWSSTRLLLIFGTLPFVVAVTVMFILKSIEGESLADIPGTLAVWGGALMAQSVFSKAADTFSKPRS